MENIADILNRRLIHPEKDHDLLLAVLQDNGLCFDEENNMWYMKPEESELKESDLDVYDVWQSPNNNLFIKLCDSYSIAIGSTINHEPSEHDLRQSQYVKSSNAIPVAKVGKVVLDHDKIRKE